MGGGNGSDDIVVTGQAPRYSRRFSIAVAGLIDHTEGGFADHPADRGGATNMGISLRFLIAEGKLDKDRDGFADFDLDMDGDLDGHDIRLLKRSDAVWLYNHCFWLRLDCESFAPPIGEMLFDQAVNGGGRAAKKLLQRAINACTAHIAGIVRLKADGVLGPMTRAGMKAVLDHPGLGMPALAQAYRDAAAARYRAIAAADPSQKAFLKGWLARANALGRDV
jgi:lysozyme family protein